MQVEQDHGSGPITPMSDLFQRFNKGSFSQFYLFKCYWQILVAEEDNWENGIVTVNMLNVNMLNRKNRQYEFLKMPCGMLNSESTLARCMKGY